MLDIDQILKEKKKILCIGDLLIDLFMEGTQSNDAEAHVIREYRAVWDCYSCNLYPGGVGGLARYLQILGNDVTLISVYGPITEHKKNEDTPTEREEEEKFKKDFTKYLCENLIINLKKIGVNCSYLVPTANRLTPIKIFTCQETNNAKGNSLWADRIDLEGSESRSIVDSETTRKLIKNIESLLQKENFDAIVIEDNEKGLLSCKEDGKIVPTDFARELSDLLAKNYSGKIFIDPKRDWSFFKKSKIYAVLPGQASVTYAANPSKVNKDSDTYRKKEPENDDIENLVKLYDEYDNIQNFIVKRGKYGIFFLQRGEQLIEKLPALSIRDPNTVGCGDVFGAYYISLILRMNNGRNKQKEAIEYSNFMAGIRAKGGMNIFPDWKKAQEYGLAIENRWTEYSFASAIEKVLSNFENSINLNSKDCFQITNNETKEPYFFARDGVIHKKLSKAITELKKPKSKLLLFGESGSGKTAFALSAAQTVSKKYACVSYQDITQDIVKNNEVLIVTDVMVDTLLSLPDKGWKIKNKDKEINLDSSKIIFDTSGVNDVINKRSDLCIKRSIPLIYLPHLKENKDLLKDATYVIGNLMLSSKFYEIEGNSLKSLYLLDFDRGKGINALIKEFKKWIKDPKNRKSEKNNEGLLIDPKIENQGKKRIAVLQRRRRDDLMIKSDLYTTKEFQETEDKDLSEDQVRELLKAGYDFEKVPNKDKWIFRRQK